MIAFACSAAGINGVICHYGLVDKMPMSADFGVILQLHGNTSFDQSKSRVSSPLLASRLDCVGVAVEFQASASSRELAVTSELVQEAHDLGLLVLIMANYRGEDFETAQKAIVGAIQLDADLVKIRLPVNDPVAEKRVRFSEVVADAPQVLVAGGEASTDLEDTLVRASRLGALGTCIGRHYFDGASRTETLRLVLNRTNK